MAAEDELAALELEAAADVELAELEEDATETAPKTPPPTASGSLLLRTDEAADL